MIIKRLSIQLLLFGMLFSVPFNAFANENDRGKSFYTPEEIKAMCGIPVNPDEMAEVLARQDSMYKEYKKSIGEKGLFKVASICQGAVKVCHYSAVESVPFLNVRTVKFSFDREGEFSDVKQDRYVE